MTPRSKFLVFILSLVLVAFSIMVDLKMHYRTSLMFIYLIPIAIATYYCGKMAGIVVAVLSAVGWYAADALLHPDGTAVLVYYWNAATRMLFFVITVFAIELKSALERERERSLTDPLTGAFNRRYFFESARTEIERCRRYKHPFTLAFLDCDDLKSVNDNLGHKAGDALLCTMAAVMKSMLRAADIVVRFGGDEFIVFMPETDHEAARKVIGRINECLLDAMRENRWDVTFSFGVITYVSPPPESTDAVIIKADELLSAAKKGGKNSIRYDVFGL